MYCQKCGTKVAEGAGFCQKCGAKLATDDTAKQKVTSIPDRQVQPRANDTQPDIPKKKKSKKLSIILGVIALVIAAIIFVAVNWEGKTDYEATVRAYTPYANSQGLPYTCGEVFDKYIPDAKWKVRESGGTTYVDISGTAKGTEKELVITMQVEAEDDRASIDPVSAKVDGRETATQKETEMVFFAFFVAYDEKYDNLSNFAEILNEIEATLQGEVSLSETYTNNAAGITFNYPNGWEILDSGSEFVVVEMIDSKNTADHIAKFNVNIILDQDPYGVFTQDEAAVRETVNESNTFIKFGDTLIGDVPVKGLTYQTSGLKGDDIVTNFWYAIGNNVYQITCSYSKSTANTYEPIFNAIMDSYIITTANTSGETGTGTSIEYPLTVSTDAMNLFAEWAVKHPLVGNYHLDLISDDDVDDDGNKIFLFTLETDGVGIFNMSIRKSDGYMEYISKFDSMSMDEWYTGISGEDDVETNSTNPGSVNSMEDAKKLVEDWMVDHPIGAEASVDSGAPANDIENVRAEYYVVVLWGDPENALGCVYVRKSDGYMSFQGLDSEDLIDLDEWYYALLRASNEALADW